jgi:hypothetical protein
MTLGFNPHAGTYNALVGKSDDAALFLAVIQQHIEDATSPYPLGSTCRKKADDNRQQARDWLLQPNTGFEEVCGLAGVGPREVRNAALAKIEAFDRKHPHVMQDAARRQSEAALTRPPLYEIDGVRKTLTEWADVAGVTVAALMKRMKRKPLAEAVAMPVRRSHSRGVGRNSAERQGTGGQSVARDSAKLEFSE